jgi:hypothetical protein
MNGTMTEEANAKTRDSITDVLGEIFAERQRQNELFITGKLPFKCDDPKWGNGVKLPVLIEEVGEVAMAMQGHGNLRRELIQVAAVAAAWAESLPEN